MKGLGAISDPSERKEKMALILKQDAIARIDFVASNFRYLDIQSALTPPINQYLKDQETDKVIFIYITAQIKRLSDSIKLNNKMTDSEITECVSLIMDEYGASLSIEDFTVFYKMCIMGKFGDIQYKMDTPKIFELIRKYIIEKSKALEQRAQYIDNEKYERHSGQQTISMRESLNQLKAKYEKRNV